MAQRKRKKASSPAKKVIPTAFFGYNNPQVRKFREKCGLPPLTGREGEVTCLRCQKKFQSKDRRRNRVCNRCRGTQAWREGSDRDPNFYSSAGNPPRSAPNTRQEKKGDE